MPASVNVLTEVVAGLAALPRITEVDNRAARLCGHFGKATQKICVVVTRSLLCFTSLTPSHTICSLFYPMYPRLILHHMHSWRY